MSTCAHILTEAKAVPYDLLVIEGTVAFELRVLNETYGTLIPRINQQTAQVHSRTHLAGARYCNCSYLS